MSGIERMVKVSDFNFTQMKNPTIPGWCRYFCSKDNRPRRKHEAKVKALLSQDATIPKEAISHCIAYLLALHRHE